ncbi:unnamed protein product [Adineta steineri]|uniref:non-specific serine/threonine protein kinase n=1 Tax=Adineta steineri TaxID=433720 RepID=A0A818YFF0_9BILA|nr:unnamed protein product [Adineta steineri]CAF3753631.1 unnamed protein product [Adineta steineri]
MVEKNIISVESRSEEIKRLILNYSINDSTVLNIDGLLDALLVLYDECCSTKWKRETAITGFVEYIRTFISRIKQNRINRNDFETIKTIGRGAIGEVIVVKMKNTEKIFAMKVMSKSEMLRKADTVCFREEHDILVSGDPQWITKLYYAFQDHKNLYLIMEYYCGGDLLTLLSRHDNQFTEEVTRFYVAEMILAIDSIHKLGYIHRDIKPDNILIDSDGHIHLADFGSSLRMKADGTVQNNIAVGTPDYISPEVLNAMNNGQGRYGIECDWWSLGCVIWEMLFGEPPFYSDTLKDTYAQIMKYGRNKIPLSFPDDTEVSDNAKDLLEKLLCPASNRLGKNGINDFKKHPFFISINWNNLRQSIPPYPPNKQKPTDTTCFDDVDVETYIKDFEASISDSGFPQQVPFIGFTYSPDTTTTVPMFSTSSTTVTRSPSIKTKMKTPSIESGSHIVYSTSPRVEAKKSEHNEHEEVVKVLKLQQTSLHEDLNRLRQLYDQTKHDSIQQKCQIQLNRDFFTEQYERSKQEQIEYLTRILNLFQDFPNPNKKEYIPKQNDLSTRIDNTKNELEQQINYFINNYKSLIMKNSNDKDKLFLNDLSLLLTKFQDEFSELFHNNGKDDISLTIEYEYDTYPVLNNLNLLLNDLYKQINKILHEKMNLSEKLMNLERKHRKYYKWITKIHKSISEDRSASIYLKNSANRMIEELDQLEELTNPRSTITSTTSSISTNANNISHVLNHSIKLQHMEIQQLKITVEREIQVRQQIEEKLKKSEAEIIRLKEENKLIKKQLIDEQSKSKARTTSSGRDQSPPHVNPVPLLAPILSPRPSNDQPLIPRSNVLHDFAIANFHLPNTCHYCQYALVGIIRQGFMCKRCSIKCHPDCMEKIETPCQLTNKDRINLSDQHIVRIPKSFGSKIEWKKCQLLIIDSKILFYDLIIDPNTTWPQPYVIFDVANEKFNTCSLALPEQKFFPDNDMANIFKISGRKMSIPERLKYLYILANNSSEKEHYIHMLSNHSKEQKTLQEKNPTKYGSFLTIEICNTNLKKITAAIILDQNRFLLSSEDGLHLFNTIDESFTKLYDKKVYQLSLISNNQLLIILSGKERMIRIKSVEHLLNHSESPFDSKIPETKNATLFTIEPISLTLCVAIKNCLCIYKIYSRPQPYSYTHICDLHTTQIVTYLDISILEINNDKERILWYGYSSTFMAQRLDQQSLSISLLRDKDPSLKIFCERPMEILRVISVKNSSSNNEILLVYRKIGIYVNFLTGMRTRHQELMWPALPILTSYSDPYLFIYTEKSIDIYNVLSGIWLQSLTISRTCPLATDGSISLCRDLEIDQNRTKLIYITQKNSKTLSVNIPRNSSNNISPRQKIRPTISSPNTVISRPSNFQHIEHIGKADGRKMVSQMASDTTTHTFQLTKKPSSPSNNNHSQLSRVNSNPNRTDQYPQNFVASHYYMDTDTQRLIDNQDHIRGQSVSNNNYSRSSSSFSVEEEEEERMYSSIDE